ncbi:MAG: acetyl-CoA carboxylase biotin carboxyl carrier protein subunit [Oscillibacter sp.]
MTNQEIFELMDRFDRSTALSLKLTRGDCALELDRRGTAQTAAVADAAPVLPAAPAPDTALYIRAPLVGSFYAAATPGKPPLVQAGDRVAKGQTLCLMEAMKMMSEIAAPCDCVVEEVLPADGALLAFDAPIFRYRAV